MNKKIIENAGLVMKRDLKSESVSLTCQNSVFVCLCEDFSVSLKVEKTSDQIFVIKNEYYNLVFSQFFFHLL